MNFDPQVKEPESANEEGDSFEIDLQILLTDFSAGTLIRFLGH